ncbi:TolC family protein [Flavihumibacter profundi]|uniref:TolC family protein n=1 Tax=Flavihumibacter profundi TaxID=2716883 RepID=UPI001CC79EB4|nr:TolC family protein [Flavihumibacter profundi]MBZ5856766.1 TolC family protein [Flavihumibacter profundi]
MKPSIVFKFLFLAFLLPAVPALAQDIRPISLEEAIELGLKNSNKLKLSTAKIDEAKAILKQAEENKLPDVSVSGSALYLPRPNINVDESLKGALGGSGGGQATKPIEVHSVFYGSLNVSEPIFSGFKIKSGIESARYLAEAAKLDSDHDRGAVIENIILAYTNLYKADAAIGVVKESLIESNQRVKDFTSLEKNGLLARNDLLKAEFEVSTLELTLLEAEKDRKLANVNMNILLGLPETSILQTSFPAKELAVDKSLEEWETLAADNRKDLAALKQREKASASSITAARGDYYPSIAVTGGLIAADIPGLLTITNATNLGLGVRYSVSSLWKTKAKISQAEARQQQIIVSQAMLNDGIRMQLNKDYQEAILAIRKIAVLEKAVEQANENYRIVKNKFNNSLATTTEVLDANVARLRAQLNIEFAKADAQVSNYKLAESAGILSTNFPASK